MIGRSIATAFILYGAWRLMAFLVGSGAIIAGLMPNGLLSFVAIVPWVVACLMLVLAMSLLALALGALA